MQLDPAFYSVIPEMRKIGGLIPSQVRTVTLWDAARASTPPSEALRNHLTQCHYCSDLLRSMLLMQKALLSVADGDFLLCPGACTLLQDPDEAQSAFTRHIVECAVCRDERTQALTSEEPAQGTPAATRPGTKVRKRIAFAAAAVVILGAVFVTGYRHFTAKKAVVPVAETTIAPEAPQIKANSKYLDLVQPVSLDDQKLLSSVKPVDQLGFMEALQDFKTGKSIQAKIMFSELANRFDDPAAQMLYAVCLYAEQADSEGYRELVKAEAMPPRASYRCWALLQKALKIGDRAVAEREIQHLSSDPEFGARAKGILVRMRSRD